VVVLVLVEIIQAHLLMLEMVVQVVEDVIKDAERKELEILHLQLHLKVILEDLDHVILPQILIQFTLLVAVVVLVLLVETVQLLQTHLQVELEEQEQQMILQEVQ
tara:strand:- start:203 stop:517 length:315 start_codon:yes stop_codon:yes gene_type:complete